MTAGLLLLAPAADDQHRSALRQQQHPIWIPRRSPNHNRLPYLVVALALSLLVIAAA